MADRSVAVDLSGDGTMLLLSEIGPGGGGPRAVYLRGMDRSPAIKLGDGEAGSLSGDGRWALANQGSNPERVVPLPAAPGRAQPRYLENGPVTDYK